MAENWIDFRVPAIPEPIDTVLNSLDEVNGAIVPVLNTLKTSLQTISAFAASVPTDPLALATQAAITSTQELITQVTSNTGVQTILIPIEKQPYGKGVPRTQAQANLSSLADPSIDSFIQQGVLSEDDYLYTLGQDAIDFISNATIQSGGSAGFYRRLYQTLSDQGDVHRPIYNETFAVTGSVIILGGSTLASIDDNIRTIEGIFNVEFRNDPVQRRTPTVQNVRAQQFYTTQTTPAAQSVLLKWDPIDPLSNLASFGDSTAINVQELMIIRSKDPDFRSKFKWLEVFSAEPPDDITQLPVTFDTEVIARIRYDGITSTYIDGSSVLERNKVFYYCVIPRVTIAGVVQPMGNFSNVARVQIGNNAISRRSVPPDWKSTPTLISVIPGLEALVTQINAELTALSSRTRNVTGLGAGFARIINQITRYVQQIQNIQRQTQEISQRLRTLSARSTQGIYLTTITVERGGIQAWMVELAKRLSDTSDPTTPNLPAGDLVVGLVFVSGAPSLAALQPYITIFDLLINNRSAPSAVAEGVGGFGTGPTRGDITFDDSLQPGTPSNSGQPENFDAALAPSVSSSEC